MLNVFGGVKSLGLSVIKFKIIVWSNGFNMDIELVFNEGDEWFEGR